MINPSEFCTFYDQIMAGAKGQSLTIDEVNNLSDCLEDTVTDILSFGRYHGVLSQSAEVYTFKSTARVIFFQMAQEIYRLLDLTDLPDAALRVFCCVVDGPVTTDLIYKDLELSQGWVRLYLEFFFQRGIIFKTLIKNVYHYTLWRDRALKLKWGSN